MTGSRQSCLFFGGPPPHYSSPIRPCTTVNENENESENFRFTRVYPPLSVSFSSSGEQPDSRMRPSFRFFFFANDVGTQNHKHLYTVLIHLRTDLPMRSEVNSSSTSLVCYLVLTGYGLQDGVTRHPTALKMPKERAMGVGSRKGSGRTSKRRNQLPLGMRYLDGSQERRDAARMRRSARTSSDPIVGNHQHSQQASARSATWAAARSACMLLVIWAAARSACHAARMRRSARTLLSGWLY